jgi:hypothetical protein
MEDIDIEEEPTTEEVKKIVDKKRAQSKTYTKEERIKNLQIAREKKKNNIKLEEKPQSKQVNIKPVAVPLESTNASKTSINFDEIINEIKNLNKKTDEIFNKLNKRKPREKKPKMETKTLDLMINDKEIENINTKVEEDEKLKLFLNALTKNKHI